MHLILTYFSGYNGMFSTLGAKYRTRSEQIYILVAFQASRVPADVAGSGYQSSERFLFSE